LGGFTLLFGIQAEGGVQSAHGQFGVLSSMTQEMRISDVPIMMMLIFSRASVLNMTDATPA
jgi:hypothetical protein